MLPEICSIFELFKNEKNIIQKSEYPTQLQKSDSRY